MEEAGSIRGGVQSEPSCCLTVGSGPEMSALRADFGLGGVAAPFLESIFFCTRLANFFNLSMCFWMVISANVSAVSGLFGSTTGSGSSVSRPGNIWATDTLNTRGSDDAEPPLSRLDTELTDCATPRCVDRTCSKGWGKRERSSSKYFD